MNQPASFRMIPGLPRRTADHDGHLKEKLAIAARSPVVSHVGVSGLFKPTRLSPVAHRLSLPHGSIKSRSVRPTFLRFQALCCFEL